MKNDHKKNKMENYIGPERGFNFIMILTFIP